MIFEGVKRSSLGILVWVYDGKPEMEEDIACVIEEKIRENKNCQQRRSQNLNQFPCQRCGMVFDNSHMFLYHSNICLITNTFQNNFGKNSASDWSMSDQRFQENSQFNFQPSSSEIRTDGIFKNFQTSIYQKISKRVKKRQNPSINSDFGSGSTGNPIGLTTQKTNRKPEIKKFTSPKKIVSKNREDYWCKICQILFTTKKSLVDHVAKNIHRKPEKPEKENINLKKIEKMKTNRKPEIKKFTNPKKIVNKNREEYWCKICQISFSTKKSLVDHVAKNICMYVVQHRKSKKLSEKKNINIPETEEEDIAIIEENIRENKNRKPKKPSEKENINPKKFKETLDGGKNRTGYWCNLCDISFSTSKLLIDHMGKNIHVKTINKK